MRQQTEKKKITSFFFFKEKEVCKFWEGRGRNSNRASVDIEKKRRDLRSCMVNATVVTWLVNSDFCIFFFFFFFLHKSRKKKKKRTGTSVSISLLFIHLKHKRKTNQIISFSFLTWNCWPLLTIFIICTM